MLIGVRRAVGADMTGTAGGWVAKPRLHPAGRPPGGEERLVPLRLRLPIQGERARHPPPPLAGPLDRSGRFPPNVRGRPRCPGRLGGGRWHTGASFRRRLTTVTPEGGHGLQERGVGVRPVGHHPQRLPQHAQPTLGPPHQLDGQLQPGPERRPVAAGAAPGPPVGRRAAPAGATRSPPTTGAGRGPPGRPTGGRTGTRGRSGRASGCGGCPPPRTCGPYRRVGVSSRARVTRGWSATGGRTTRPARRAAT